MAKILIADDAQDMVTVLASRFRALGHQVIEANDGIQALELAQREKPDLVLLDVMMPELNGFQVCRRMKSDPALAKVPVVLLTAKDTDADRFWGSEVGADAYLTKPVDPGAVVLRVQEILGR
jgi:DNA-binding response OmpR family regulator